MSLLGGYLLVHLCLFLLFPFLRFWAQLMFVLLFCIQESAKAALKMKDCQMTDRTTQTEHMGPEVRYTQTTHTSFL